MIPSYANKRIYTTEAIEREGNSIMGHQRGRFFIIDAVLLESITRTHVRDVDSYAAASILLATGEKLPHVVIDENGVVMDGNTRVEVYKDSDLKKIRVFRAVAEVFKE